MNKKMLFYTLSSLPAEHGFWKNQWMFTRQVFMQESRQMSDEKAFWYWFAESHVALRRYIAGAPNRI